MTRQWPLPREQVEAIDAFFESRRKAGHVRESISPHSSPTFCVRKATGGWRIVHAFNKLNDATIPAQTPIPRKDMILDGMSGSTVFSTIDLMDGFYQILMRESDVPLTAVSTPSGMLWEWLVMPQGLKNAPATFNRMVSHALRPFRSFAPSYFDDIFVHSKAEDSRSDAQVHSDHLRQVFQAMRDNKLYANLKKCVFFAPEIPVLGCFVSRDGVRVDPEKVSSICSWPVPKNQKQLRQWLGLANYLHKYTKNYAELVRPLSQLLKKESDWRWTEEHQTAFAAVKKSLQEAPVLALPDYDRPFHVVCDASDYAIGCALMQHDADGHERVVSYQSRQLKAAERNYPVHDKELLAMKYALVKFRVYLLGEQQFAIYTDHASLRTATKSPHLSQRMARWLSFFAEYNFVVFYKPGKTNILADALSRRPDYDPRERVDPSTHAECMGCSCEEDLKAVAVTATSSIRDEIIRCYAADPLCQDLLAYLSKPNETSLARLPSRTRARVHRFLLQDGLLYYCVDVADAPRIVVPDDASLRSRLLHEYHDCPVSGHLGREKTYLALSRDYFWPHQYKWVRKWVRTCEVCQRVKPSPASQAPLRSLPVPADAWDSVSMDFVFGFPQDSQGRDIILVFVDRLTKMVHLAPVRQSITAAETAAVFLDTVFRLHGIPSTIISDRDPRFTSLFWRALFELLGTRLQMSTAAHPETDGQTERVNRVLEDVLRSYATSFSEWSAFLPLVEFALNNSVHVSSGLSPFYVNYARHPRVPSNLVDPLRESNSGGGGAQKDFPALDADTTSSGVPNVEDLDVLAPCETASVTGSDEETDGCVAGEADAEDKFNFSAAPELNTLAPRERKFLEEFVKKRQAIIRLVRDSVADAVDKQKESADKHGRGNKNKFKPGQRVLLSTQNLPYASVSNLGAKKLLPRYIGPFKVTNVVGDAYTIDLPSKMRLHPTFYVGRLKPYLPPEDFATDQSLADPPTPPDPIQEEGLPPRPSSPPSQHSKDRRAGACVKESLAHSPTKALAHSPTRAKRGTHRGRHGEISPAPPSAGESRHSSRVAPRLQPRGRRRHCSPALPVVQHRARGIPPSVQGAATTRRRTDRESSERHAQRANDLDPSEHDQHRRADRSRVVRHARAPDESRRTTRHRFVRDGPPPVVDSNGDRRWIVDRIVAHEDRAAPSNPSAVPGSKTKKSRKQNQTTRFFRVRWLGYPGDQDSWLPEEMIREDVPDLVAEYETQ